MKSLADLHALRDKLKADIKLRQSSGTKIIVGMGTCGIAAGAREVLVDVVRPGEARITYGKVTPEDVPKIIAEHVVNGHIVEELVVGRLDQE